MITELVKYSDIYACHIWQDTGNIGFCVIHLFDVCSDCYAGWVLKLYEIGKNWMNMGADPGFCAGARRKVESGSCAPSEGQRLETKPLLEGLDSHPLQKVKY